MALIQIRYTTGAVRTRSMRAFYRLDPAGVTTYAIDTFWTLCAEHGLEPQLLALEPEEEVIGDRYAYLRPGAERLTARSGGVSVQSIPRRLAGPSDRAALRPHQPETRPW